MRLSAKTEYACLALLQLATEYDSGRPLQVRRMSADQGIPEGFLVQILQQLKRTGLVTSTRGPTGGYRLAVAPDETSLGQVLDVLDGPEPPTSSLAAPTPLADALQQVCHELDAAQRARLAEITLADLASQAATPRSPMWYI